MPKYEHHIFVCENYRDPSDPRGCCSAKGSKEIRAALKKEIKHRGLKGKVRANAAGCLDECQHGPVIVIYPEAVWYKNVSIDDVDEIIESHIIHNQPVARLLLK
jgi:(2Fe-2S) ferredoxin